MAPYAFLAKLPQSLLSHSQGGMLAIIGRVERAWTFSFSNGAAKSMIEPFIQCMNRLMDGYPVGAALEPFNQRYAEAAAILTRELEDIKFGKQVPPAELARLWMQLNDARNYIVIGDPAARLPPTSVLANDHPRPTLAEIEALMAEES